MPKCTINGKEIEFAPGTNLIEVARQGGIEIPYFCYHPGLSVVAQCRMCLVEVEKMPKLQTACSTPATDGMVVHTTSPRVKESQKSTMEFLLINHPLDCPICDKAGECDLQDLSFKYGSAYMRYTEERREFQDDDMGPVIKKDMNRCIHCTRCIRFADEVAGIREIVAVSRGNHTEITTVDNQPLQTGYAGCYADVCPTGSLTLKDFRFKKRVWYLKRTDTVCEGCARGCNMYLDQADNVIYRCTPKTNMEVNRYWMCDEGRFNFHYVGSPERVIVPSVDGSWDRSIAKAVSLLEGKKIAILVGSDLTNEEVELIQRFAAKAFPGAPLSHFGTPGIRSAADDADEDNILKRKSKTSNLHGIEKLGLKGYDGLKAGTEGVLVFRGGRAQLPELGGVPIVGIGVFFRPEIKGLSAVLPGAAFAEKDGTVVNFQGKAQKLQAGVKPPGESKQLFEILTRWMNERKPGASANG
jgi:NADH-quinone oxidoreductase subunit G